MTESVLSLTIVGAIGVVGAVACFVIAGRNYRGRSRRFLSYRPWGLPLGRYWGLLTMVLLGLTVLAICSGVASVVAGDLSDAPGTSFAITTLPGLIVLALAYLFSWWLPVSWRPRWLRDLDREPGPGMIGARVAAGPVSLVPPPGWTSGPLLPGTAAVLLAPPPADGGFRPNLVVVSEPSEASAAKLATVTLATHQVVMADYHLIDVDRWDRAVPDGRRFEYLHRQGATALHAVQYTAALPGSAVHITFTCAEHQVADCDAVFLACADTIEAAP